MSDDDSGSGSDGGKVESVGRMKQRHRKEAKALKVKTDAMLRDVPRSNKAKRAEVSAEIKRLEAEFDERCKSELAAAQSRAQEQEAAHERETAEAWQREQDERAAREIARTRKAHQEAEEREARRLEALASAGESARDVESAQLAEQLSKQGKVIVEIAPDGNCLFSAVVHQLARIGREMKAPDMALQMRQFAVDFIYRCRGDFIPFMTIDSDDVDAAVNAYCEKMLKQDVWGGELEIRALSEFNKCHIIVYQANLEPLHFGEQYDSLNPPLEISYHRHYYASGAHYNSVVTIAEAEAAASAGSSKAKGAASARAHDDDDDDDGAGAGDVLPEAELAAMRRDEAASDMQSRRRDRKYVKTTRVVPL